MQQEAADYIADVYDREAEKRYSSRKQEQTTQHAEPQATSSRLHIPKQQQLPHPNIPLLQQEGQTT